MKNVVALVLAGGRMGDYGVLTQNRAKGALTFGGVYRVIDFALSNLVNSGVNKIGLIIQYLPGSLIEHVGSGHPWDLDNYGKILKIMPPFVGLAQTVWYNGTADALLRNLNFVREQKAEHVIVLSGEHAFHVDFADVLSRHIARNSDITVITKELPPEEQKLRFGYVQTDNDGRVTQYNEKPAAPTSNVAATGIYVFKSSVLNELLTTQSDVHERNLAKDILQPYAHKVLTHVYRTDGCWEYMETVRDYYNVQRELMRGGSLELMRQWNIMTNLKFRHMGHAPAAAFGKAAHVEGSLISPACRIDGTVIDSILSPGVTVDAGAVVSNSILMHDCHVGGGARLNHVISDRDVTFGSGCIVGELDAGASRGAGDAHGVEHPLTLMGKAAQIGNDIVIPPGAQVRPGKKLSSQEMANMEI